MVRRIAVLLAGAAIASTGLVPIGLGPAHAVKVVANGSIACDWVSGTVKLKPRFVNGGTTPGVVKFKGVLGNCRDDSGEEGPVPFGITGGRITGSFSLSTNACTAGDPVTGGAGSARINWTAPQKLAPTKFTAADSGYQFDADGTYFSLPADYLNESGTVTGSFSGPPSMTASQIFGTANELGAPVQLACTPKTKGLPGSGGLKKLTLVDSLALFLTSPAVPSSP